MYLDVISHNEINPGCFIRVYGISLQMIAQASDLNTKTVQIYGGMYPGLPLATQQSAYAGLLFTGTIYAGFGNWEGTEMSLDMLLQIGGSGSTDAPADSGTSAGTPLGQGGIGHQSVTPSRLMRRAPRAFGVVAAPPSPTQTDFFGGVQSIVSNLESMLGTLASGFGGGGFAKKPLNLTWNLQPGQLVSDAIRQTLSKAFPKAKLNIQISPNLKLQYQDAGFYQSLPQFAQYMRALSLSILGTKGYQGVKIWSKDKTINVTDGTTKSSSVKTIQYSDLIGQPTWIGPKLMIIKMVMRSDIDIDTEMKLPQGIPVLVQPQQQLSSEATGQGISLPSLTLTFNGTFKAQRIIHTGDSRHPDGAQWCTVVEALAEDAGSGQEGPATTTNDANATYGLPPGSPSNVTGPHLIQRKVRRYV